MSNDDPDQDEVGVSIKYQLDGDTQVFIFAVDAKTAIAELKILKKEFEKK